MKEHICKIIGKLKADYISRYPELGSNSVFEYYTQEFSDFGEDRTSNEQLSRDILTKYRILVTDLDKRIDYGLLEGFALEAIERISECVTCQVLDMPIEEFCNMHLGPNQIPIGLREALMRQYREGTIEKVRDLVEMTEDEIYCWRGIGKKYLERLNKILGKYSLKIKSLFDSNSVAA